MENLKTLLSKNIVKFKFIKKDGSERIAIGSTNLNFIPTEFHPKTGKASSDKVIVFFDLEKLSWRSLSISSAYEIIELKEFGAFSLI